MKSVFAYLNIFISTLVVSVYGKYADKVSASEVSLATRLDDFVSNNPNTYQFIALASNGSVVAQSLWVNDTIAFEAFFTNTETLDAYIKSNQIAGYQAAVTSGYDTPSLEEIQAYRYDVDDLLKRTNTPSHPDSEPRDNGRLADCGQPCSAGSDCPGRCPDCELLDGERVCIRANKDSSYNVNDLSKRSYPPSRPAFESRNNKRLEKRQDCSIDCTRDDDCRGGNCPHCRYSGTEGRYVCDPLHKREIPGPVSEPRSNGRLESRQGSCHASCQSNSDCSSPCLYCNRDTVYEKYCSD